MLTGVRFVRPSDENARRVNAPDGPTPWNRSLFGARCLAAATAVFTAPASCSQKRQYIRSQ